MQPKDIKLWRVYHVPNCVYTDPPKSKYAICVGKEGLDEFWAFLINSRIHPFIQNNPDLLLCQSQILADEHRILQRDSFVDCKDLYKFTAWDFRSDKGAISSAARNHILEAVQQCPTLKRKHKKMIFANAGQSLE